MGRRDGSGQSSLAARAHSQSPGLDNLYTAGWRERGRGLPGPCTLPSTSAQLGVIRFPALYLGQVWSPFEEGREEGRACPVSQPGQLPEERAGAGMVLAHRDTAHRCHGSPATAAQAGWGTAGAERGSLPLWVSRAMGRVGEGQRSSQVGGLVVRGWARAAVPEDPCSEPGPGPSTALPGGLPGRTAALTLRESINLGTFLPGGASRCGDEGNSVAENRADRASPAQDQRGVYRRPRLHPDSKLRPVRPETNPPPGVASASRASSGSPEAPKSNPSSWPAGQACHLPACPSLLRQLPSSGASVS